MPWDKLDWTQIGASALFILLVVVQAVRGFFGGRREGPAPAASVEVAGALIDTKRVDMLIAELGALSASAVADRKGMDSLREAMDLNRLALEHNTRTASAVSEHADKLAREMRDLRDETKDLRDEMLRRGGRG